MEVVQDSKAEDGSVRSNDPLVESSSLVTDSLKKQDSIASESDSAQSSSPSLKTDSSQNPMPANQSSSELLRPSIYPSGPHVPVPRFSILEENLLDPDFQIMQELKSHRMEGFYNLSLLLLCFSIGYNVVRNVRENGLLVEFRSLLCYSLVEDIAFAVVLSLSVMLYSTSVYLIAKLFFTQCTALVRTRTLCYVCVQLWLYIGVSILVLVREPTPFVGGYIALHTVVFSLKIHSYYATNLLMFLETKAMHKTLPNPNNLASIPALKNEGAKQLNNDSVLGFPHNLTWSNFAFFMFVAPSLVYETKYPRTSVVRVSYIAIYSAQIIAIVFIQYFLLSQFLIPTITHPSGSFVFDVMRLAMPSIFIWLFGFYGFFHCGLNTWAEITRFADRQFYREWFNATTLDSFWNKWNVPVHEWCLRHIFVESQAKYKVSKANAALATFLLSAVLHEYIFALAFRTLRPAMFAGMLAQVPFIYVLRKLGKHGERRGNLVVWINLFFGHPLIEILYLREYYETHDRLSLCRA